MVVSVAMYSRRWHGDTRNGLSGHPKFQRDGVRVTADDPHGVCAALRQKPCVIFSQDTETESGRGLASIILHDAGGIDDDGNEYGFLLRWKDGSTTCVTDWALPVDRWVYLAATYDGSYLSVYIDGKLTASKAREAPGKHCPVASSNGAFRIGSGVRRRDGTRDDGFVGMVSHVRLWKTARTLNQIGSSQHNRKVEITDSRVVHNVEQLFMPNSSELLGGKDRMALFCDIAFYDLSRLSHRKIADASIYGVNAHLLGSYGWRINPPAYFGSKRVYAVIRNGVKHFKDQVTTVVAETHSKHWGWKPLFSLSEEFRSFGNVFVTARWCHDDITGKDASFRPVPTNF